MTSCPEVSAKQLTGPVNQHQVVETVQRKVRSHENNLCLMKAGVDEREHGKEETCTFFYAVKVLCDILLRLF